MACLKALTAVGFTLKTPGMAVTGVASPGLRGCWAMFLTTGTATCWPVGNLASVRGALELSTLTERGRPLGWGVGSLAITTRPLRPLMLAEANWFCWLEGTLAKTRLPGLTC